MKLEDHCFNAVPPGQRDAVSCVTLSMALAAIEQAREDEARIWSNAVASVVSSEQATKIAAAIRARKP